MTLLEVDNVVAGYGDGPDILRGVSLKFNLGNTYCIIGPNGAGKSTLFKTITGLLHPREGRVIYQGEDISGLRTDQILRKGICFVPQDRSLFPDMTVKENLRMGGYILDNQHDLAGRMEDIFQMFPILKERSSQHASTLSGGEQQMLAIGRTLMLKPDVILLDEPSLGLAPKVARQIFDCIETLKTAEITILLVEQNARIGLGCADHGVVLDLGKAKFKGRAKIILTDPRIQELYLGKRR